MTERCLAVSCLIYVATWAKLHSVRAVEWVKTCCHQRRFVQNSTDSCTRQEHPKMNSFFLFSFFFWNAINNIQLWSQLSSWCIYRFGFLFLMWRERHLCSHLPSVQCAVSGQTWVPTGETSILLFQQTPEPRESAASHLMTSCGMKTQRLHRTHNGDQFNRWQHRGWCIHISYNSLFFICAWNDCYFKNIDGFATAAHLSDAAADTCCHSRWSQLSQPWIFVLCWENCCAKRDKTSLTSFP